jgi:hypothetical protein
MPKGSITFDAVVKIGLTLPGVEEGTSWGNPALKLRGQMLAGVPTHRSAEPNSIVVRIGFDDRAALLAEAPDTYYIKDHYLGYTAVLVRLQSIQPDQLRDLLGAAHKFMSHKYAKRSAAPKRRSPGRKKSTKDPE